MPRGDKFLELTTYLENTGKDEIKMTFSEIEHIIGFKLHKSAYSYPAQWANTESQSFPFAWMNAGYLSEQLDLNAQSIVFRKAGSIPNKATITKVREERLEQTKAYKLPIDIAIQNIKEYFYQTVKDPNGRYLSWCHCYKAFTDNRNKVNEQTLDYLSLHLAFYLASWGMLRGSSFLLQKDYKVHIPVVKIIMEERYNSLCGISAEALMEDGNLALLDEISERIKNAYAEHLPSKNDVINNATDTLITKILLGTLGCVPAYDRYYVKAVKDYNISIGSYCRKSVRSVAGYYVANKAAFEELRAELGVSGTDYPPMKLMDMCMWQVAFEEELNT